MAKIPNESLFQTGTCYSEWKTQQDGFIFEWDENSGFTLYAMLNGMSNDELKQFDVSEPLEVRYTVVDDIAFFLYKFGNMEWADCPFEPSLYASYRNGCNLPELEENEGFAVTVLLIDTSTGKLCKIRLISLGHEFSKTFASWVKERVHANMTMDEYHKRIDKAYRQYLSVDFAKKAYNEGKCYVVGTQGKG